jgi:cytochrome c biogenesis protein CcdA
MGEWDALPGILGLAFGLGLLHALDADHILAVSSLASRDPGARRRPWRFCLRWALGHGLTLLLLGTLAWGIGAGLPVALSRYAETGVGLLLIGMGAWVWRDVRRQSLQLRFHSHRDLPRHAHWQPPALGGNPQHDHGATLVGALHGTAGSAPLLALLPIATQQSPGPGLLYLALFSLGTLSAMLLFGGLLGVLFGRVARWGAQGLHLLRRVLALGSVAAGLYLLHSVAT